MSNVVKVWKPLLMLPIIAMMFMVSTVSADESIGNSTGMDYFQSLNTDGIELLSQEQMQETEGEYYMIVLRLGSSGLKFIVPVTRNYAVKVLKRGDDVWSSSRSQARSIARAASDNGRAFLESTSSILRGNYNHYHDTFRRSGHSFFGSPR